MYFERLSIDGFLELSSSGFGVGGDTMLHEVAECDCADEPVGCEGEVEELGASRASVPAPASARSSRSTTPWRIGVVGGFGDEAGNCGFHCPGLVSVHFCTVDCCAEPELVGCSCIACGAAESRTGTHSAQRVLEKPLRQWMPQNGL